MWMWMCMCICMWISIFVGVCISMYAYVLVFVCMSFSFIARTSGGYKINIRMRGDMPWLVTDLDRCPAKRGNNCNTRVGSI